MNAKLKRYLQWIIANRFIHMGQYLKEIVDKAPPDVVTRKLMKHFHRKQKDAIWLGRLNILLAIMVSFSVISTFASSFILSLSAYLEARGNAPISLSIVNLLLNWVGTFAMAFSAISLLLVILMLAVQRGIKLVESDLLMISMQIVSRMPVDTLDEYSIFDVDMEEDEPESEQDDVEEKEKKKTGREKYPARLKKFQKQEQEH